MSKIVIFPDDPRKISVLNEDEVIGKIKYLILEGSIGFASGPKYDSYCLYVESVLAEEGPRIFVPPGYAFVTLGFILNNKKENLGHVYATYGLRLPPRREEIIFESNKGIIKERREFFDYDPTKIKSASLVSDQFPPSKVENNAIVLRLTLPLFIEKLRKRHLRPKSLEGEVCEEFIKVLSR
ncbi:MAG: hypothetical protein AABW58_03475 [Nanoarchaeota archaeon]